MKTLDINEKQNIGYCISTELRDEQIKININKVKGRVVPAEELKKDKIAVVSFGPSLNYTWQELKNFKYIMTCSGAHKFLVEKGITPTYHLDLDPREHKITMLGQPQKETEYLIASTIHPKYLDQLNGYNVKLWHIFASDEDAVRVLPKGEWALTGGSSVGLRTLHMARFLGFTDIHVFGMDGSFDKIGSHATYHPNSPKDQYETEYNGVKYVTTPSMLFCAKQTFQELDQLHDVTATFYGEGLVQAMAKDYKPNKKKGADIAYSSPELISKEYVDLNRKLHEENPTYGMGGSKYKDTVIKLANTLITPENKFIEVLDYGCGKGMLAKSLPFPIAEYDPAVPGKDSIPRPADLTICTDVLEHIEPDKLNFVLDDLRRCTKQIGYFVISTRKAVKTYSNGENAHLIVRGKEWWEKKLSKYFYVGTVIDKEKEKELHVIVGPKKNVESNLDISVVEDDGFKFKFYTPNETTKWRANTLLTKEPCTVEWIKSIKPGEVLYDVGANIGSYTIMAGVRGVTVYSFEPEAENYTLLIKNMELNNIKETAYCLAISDKISVDMLNLSQRGVGGSCHTFGGEGKKISQGCFGISLGDLINLGLPAPDHIKIDVDGNELDVIEGLRLSLISVKSIIIEIDPYSSSHKKILKKMKGYGFEYDQNQVDKATRKEGVFKGYAEYIFKNKIFYPTIRQTPYPHFVINGVFTPEEYYSISDISRNTTYLSLEEARGTKGYPERYVSKLDERELSIINPAIERLKKQICEAFGLNINDYDQDLLLINDKPGYKIGVHRDRLDKVVTALVYLADNRHNEFAGTAIYKPKKEGFVCPIGKHYGFDEFDKVETIGYVPNRAFVFLNTDHSFHGVEPCSVERHVLLLNLNKKK